MYHASLITKAFLVILHNGGGNLERDIYCFNLYYIYIYILYISNIFSYVYIQPKVIP